MDKSKFKGKPKSETNCLCEQYFISVFRFDEQIEYNQECSVVVSGQRRISLSESPSPTKW